MTVQPAFLGLPPANSIQAGEIPACTNPGSPEIKPERTTTERHGPDDDRQLGQRPEFGHRRRCCLVAAPIQRSLFGPETFLRFSLPSLAPIPIEGLR